MMLLLSLLALLLAPAAPGVQRAQRAQPETPDLADALTLDGARPLFENDRATVWDFTWTRGVPGPLEHKTSESLWISVPAGAVTYWTKGADRRAPRSDGSPLRMIAIDLKDHPVAPLTNTSGFPNAFPRPNGQKIVENDRVIVWDYTWTPGQPTPMHFHDKDVVVVYLQNGSLRSTTPDGKSVVSKWTPGDTRFNLRDRVHTETLVDGTLRAIITEFK